MLILIKKTLSLVFNLFRKMVAASILALFQVLEVKIIKKSIFILLKMAINKS